MLFLPLFYLFDLVIQECVSMSSCSFSHQVCHLSQILSRLFVFSIWPESCDCRCLVSLIHVWLSSASVKLLISCSVHSCRILFVLQKPPLHCHQKCLHVSAYWSCFTCIQRFRPSSSLSQPFFLTAIARHLFVYFPSFRRLIPLWHFLFWFHVAFLVLISRRLFPSVGTTIVR